MVSAAEKLKITVDDYLQAEASAEVLSPSTGTFDRGQKFSAYRQLEILQTYWLIDSQKMSVDGYNRTVDNEWLFA